MLKFISIELQRAKKFFFLSTWSFSSSSLKSIFNTIKFDFQIPLNTFQFFELLRDDLLGWSYRNVTDLTFWISPQSCKRFMYAKLYWSCSLTTRLLLSSNILRKDVPSKWRVSLKTVKIIRKRKLKEIF